MDNNNDLLSKLQRESSGYSKRQRSLARYICDNCDKAAFMTADMLSAAAGASESSVVRFARQLGYGGYSEMRRDLQQIIRRKLSGMDADMDGAAYERLKSAVASESKSLQSIVCEQNERALEAAAAAVRAADTVYVQGMGALAGLALHMVLRLRALGCRAVMLNGFDPTAGLFDIAGRDVYVSISSSLYAGRISALHYAKDKGAVTVLICSGELTAAAKYADHRLFADGDAAIMGLMSALFSTLRQDIAETPEDALRRMEEKRQEYLAYEYEEY